MFQKAVSLGAKRKRSVLGVGIVFASLLALALVCAFPLVAADQTIAVFSDVGANGTYSVAVPDNTRRACVAIWAPIAATATVTVYVNQGGSSVPVATYANPATSGKVFCGPTADGLVIVVSGWSVGTVSSTVAAYLK